MEIKRESNYEDYHNYYNHDSRLSQENVIKFKAITDFIY